MTNKEIAKTFQYLGQIMELHGENPFKIRSYQNAYMTLRKMDQPLADLALAELESIKGVGKAISSKIRELVDTGHLSTLQKYEDKTPEGIREMLHIKGFGPKKIAVIWKDLEVETIGELLYAVNENRLVELKGFGLKTQQDLKVKLEYYLKSKNQYHYATLDMETQFLTTSFGDAFPDLRVERTGPLRRKDIVLDAIDLLIEASGKTVLKDWPAITLEEDTGASWKGRTANDYPIRMYFSAIDSWGQQQFQHTGDPVFLNRFESDFGKAGPVANESQLFEQAGLPFIVAELRNDDWILEQAKEQQVPTLVEEQEILGVVHAHSTYSDGLNSIREMVDEAQTLGYSYLGLTDHSRSAFYANGLTEERVRKQWEEIDRINEGLKGFRLFKGIESDILNDGSLDYPEELLSGFDFIIASIHSNLRMDESKATNRLIKAIENPFTTILGHPTGRLLLSRPGYPIHHKAVIDACADNKVAIELNANPYRLDLDWSWIPYALEKGVWISINPDAHSLSGIRDIRYGVAAARKGGLEAAQCLNCLTTKDFDNWIQQKKPA